MSKCHDQIITTFYDSAIKQKESQCIEEIKMYYDCRYLSSCETTWKIFTFNIQYRKPSIERSSFHLPSEYVVFDEDDPIEEVVNKTKNNTPKFLA